MVQEQQRARLIMVQGTHSNCGKTTLVAGLCRAITQSYTQRRVAPFKPQNLALNSAVTVDGGEIGRSQALQAAACRVQPTVHMNPIILKPNQGASGGIQVVLQGHVAPPPPLDCTDRQLVSAHYKQLSEEAVMTSFNTLAAEFDVIVAEGNGSPAELNMRQREVGNMAFAVRAAEEMRKARPREDTQTEGDVPPFVILVGDIDRGGVFAHLFGTYEMLSAEDKKLVLGFLVNKVDLFDGGACLKPSIAGLEHRTGKQVLGLIPKLDSEITLHLDDEDADDIVGNNGNDSASPHLLRVGVFNLPRLSNHTDFDPLKRHNNIHLEFIDLQRSPAEQPSSTNQFDILIIPGTKTVRDDLAALRTNHWDRFIFRHLRYGGKLIGVCGGYQMLGAVIRDPHGVEGTPGSTEGLGLFPSSETTISPAGKTLTRVSGSLHLGVQVAAIEGYEIHAGVTTHSVVEATTIGGSQKKDDMPSTLIHDLRQLHQDGTATCCTTDGLISADGQVLGTYLHGLFDHPDAFRLLLQWMLHGSDDGAVLTNEPSPIDPTSLREESLERLGAVIANAVDLKAILGD